MIALTLALALAAAPPAVGEAELTIDGVTTTHAVKACSIEAEGAMPARLLIEDAHVTLNISQADHVQMISLIQDNRNWSASRLFIGQNWIDQGQPGEPIVLEWGELIRIEAALTSGQAAGEKRVSVTARCA